MKVLLGIFLLALIIGRPSMGRGEDLPSYQRAIAVVVGIAKYQHSPARCQKPPRDDEWNCLPNALVDAKHFAKKMRELGLEVIPLYEWDARSDAILEALEAAEYKLKATPGYPKHTLLVFYFAGHGATVEGKGYIVPYEGDRRRKARWITMGTIRQKAQEMVGAKHQLYIFASCFGGTVLRSAPGTAIDELKAFRPALEWLDEAFKSTVRAAITAGGPEQQIPDGPESQGSEFGTALVAALAPAQGGIFDRADFNKDGCVSFSELSAYVQGNGRTSDNTPRAGRLEGDNLGELVFCRKSLLMKVTRDAPPLTPAGPMHSMGRSTDPEASMRSPTPSAADLIRTPQATPADSIDAQFERLFGEREGAAAVESPPKSERPKSSPIIPPTLGDVVDITRVYLEVSDIMEVVLANEELIKKCSEASDASGTIVMRWTIRPDGNTTAIQTVTPEFQKTPLATCVTSVIKGFIFPPYSGMQMTPISFPFKL